MGINLAQGVQLHVIPTKKYKTVRMLVRFSELLNKETITKRSILSSLMETNSLNYPTQTDISEKLAALYGASFGMNVTKKGEYHLFNVHMSVVNDKFLLNEENTLKESVDFLKEMIFYPNIQQGTFDKETYERETNNLKEYIESVFDDKQSHAALALQELYFNEASHQKIPSFGSIKDIEAESATSIAAYYEKFINENQVDIFVIGDVTEMQMEQLFADFPFIDRKPVQQNIFYQQLPKEKPLEKKEKLAVVQSKLNIAYQTNIYYQSDCYYALLMFNGIFGGFPHSKLFMNVREKESMAYYASSSFDTFRGILTVQTGIDGKNKERVLQLVTEQLTAMRQGEISDEELFLTKQMWKTQYLLSLDNAAAVLEKEYVQSIMGEISDEEIFSKVDAVTKEEIIKVAQKIQLQAIYFMEGGAM